MIWDELVDAFQQSRKIVLIVEKHASHSLLTLFCQVKKKKKSSIFSFGSMLIDVTFHSKICMFNYSFPLTSVFVIFTIH